MFSIRGTADAAGGAPLPHFTAYHKPIQNINSPHIFSVSIHQAPGKEKPAGGRGRGGKFRGRVTAAGPAVLPHRRHGRSPCARRPAAGGLRPVSCGLQKAAGSPRQRSMDKKRPRRGNGRGLDGIIFDFRAPCGPCGPGCPARFGSHWRR